MAQGSDAAIHRLEQSVGPLTNAAIAKMNDDLPWFRALTAEDRSWIGLIAGAGISSFVEWFRDEPASARERPFPRTSSAPRRGS